jgi:hypothetical protein
VAGKARQPRLLHRLRVSLRPHSKVIKPCPNLMSQASFALLSTQI